MGAGESAKYWLAVLTEIKNRGVADVCIAVRDGLAGLGEAITTVRLRTVVQACVLHPHDEAYAVPARRRGHVVGQDGR